MAFSLMFAMIGKRGEPIATTIILFIELTMELD